MIVIRIKWQGTHLNTNRCQDKGMCIHYKFSALCFSVVLSLLKSQQGQQWVLGPKDPFLIDLWYRVRIMKQLFLSLLSPLTCWQQLLCVLGVSQCSQGLQSVYIPLQVELVRLWVSLELSHLKRFEPLVEYEAGSPNDEACVTGQRSTLLWKPRCAQLWLLVSVAMEKTRLLLQCLP